MSVKLNISPIFQTSNLGVGISEGCFTIRFITVGGRSAHLA